MSLNPNLHGVLGLWDLQKFRMLTSNLHVPVHHPGDQLDGFESGFRLLHHATFLHSMHARIASVPWDVTRLLGWLYLITTSACHFLTGLMSTEPNSPEHFSGQQRFLSGKSC